MALHAISDTHRAVSFEPCSTALDQVIETLSTDPNTGLDREEIIQRQNEFGRNELKEIKPQSLVKIVVAQFRSVIVGLLIIAVLVSFLMGEALEASAILAVIIINAFLGFWMELRAVRSMEALRKLTKVHCTVLRNGNLERIDAAELVPGDIVVLEGGDLVTADIRLIEGSKLAVDESLLTGESVPVGKAVSELPSTTILTDQKNMLFKGTSVTRGSAKAVVVKIGLDTELGKISTLLEEAEEEQTPLEKRLDSLGQKLVWFMVGVSILTGVVGVAVGKSSYLMFHTVVALIVAAIPEGLPIVATIALARGMWRMGKKNALVNRLSAVETLGSTSVIFSDKTGTLTENKMTVEELVLPNRQSIRFSKNVSNHLEVCSTEPSLSSDETKNLLHKAVRVGVLCNNAELSEDVQNGSVGDPLEIALLEAGRAIDLEKSELLTSLPEIREEAFDPEVKLMGTFHRTTDGVLVQVKGAAEELIPLCNTTYSPGSSKAMTDEDASGWLELNCEMASSGLRIIALAEKIVESEDSDPYSDLSFIGLVALKDPPRRDVKESITAFKKAGVQVVMVTGDQAQTALNIAREVGISDSNEQACVVSGDKLEELLAQQGHIDFSKHNIFARINPKQKLRLIESYQKQGEIVAMTGDGVNDAPALQKADIGVAMGFRGTEVAKEAADMVLKDDSFSTILSAVAEGRVIFSNIRKFVVYLMSCNLSEILTVGIASLVNAPLPILPLQILFLNLVTDVFPALALAMGEGEEYLMKSPTRSAQEGVLKRKHWYTIVGLGLLITATVLGAFAVSLLVLEMNEKQAVTVSFLVLALTQLWNVFNMRSYKAKKLSNEITKNPFIWSAIVLCLVILLLAVHLPVISDALSIVNPGVIGWIIVIGFSLVPLIAVQALVMPTLQFLSRAKGLHSKNYL